MALNTLTTAATDLRAAAVLDQEINLLLFDMVAMRKVPGYVLDKGSVNGTLSSVKRVRFAGLDGYDAMASVNEGTSTSSTTITDASADITVARLALEYDVTDLLNLTGSAEDIGNPERLAKAMVGAAERGFNSLVVNVGDDWTTDAVDSAVAMTSDDAYDAAYQLELNSVPGPYYGTLAPRQHTHMRDSLRSEVGPAQYVEATQQQVTETMGQGFQGRFLGIDWWNVSQVLTSGGKRLGWVHGQGGLGYAHGSPTIMPNAGTAVRKYGENQQLFVEIARDAAGALTKVVGNFYVGVAILEQARGYGLNTSST